MPKKNKKNVKVRDMKPTKDAKGGSGPHPAPQRHHPGHPVQGHHGHPEN